MGHWVIKFEGQVVGFYAHESIARGVATALGAGSSVEAAEGAPPTNAEQMGLRLRPSNDNARKLAFLAPAKAATNPVFERSALRLVGGVK